MRSLENKRSAYGSLALSDDGVSTVGGVSVSVRSESVSSVSEGGVSDSVSGVDELSLGASLLSGDSESKESDYCEDFHCMRSEVNIEPLPLAYIRTLTCPLVDTDEGEREEEGAEGSERELQNLLGFFEARTELLDS